MTANLAQSPVVVPTPACLQRRMTRNLQATAHSRINRKRAAKAREILAAIDRDSTVQMARYPKETAASADGVTVAAVIEHKRTGSASDSGRPSRGNGWTARLGGTAKAILSRVSRWRPIRRAALTS